MPHPNIMQHLCRLAADQPERLALIEPSGASMRFAELEARSAAIAGGLRQRGAEEGARILALAPMGISLYLALLAVFRAGCTAVLLDPSAPREKLRPLLGSLDLFGFIGSPKAQLLRLLHKELRGLRLYGCTGFTPLPAKRLRALEGPPLAPQPSQAPALITFTTGSTGRPRAMARSHAFLDAQRKALTAHMDIGPDDVDLATLPVFLLNSLSAGATCVLADADLTRPASASPTRIAAQLLRWEVTLCSGSPAFFAPLAAHLRAADQQLPALRKLFVGGGRVPSALLEDLLAMAPSARVEVHYGSTEADPMATADAREVLALGGDGAGQGSCVGRAVPGIQLEIWQPGGSQALPTGEAGEVAVAGEHVNQGYFRDPEADARCKLRKDGRIWHRTGDLGRLDDQGRLWLLGRVGEAAGGALPLVAEGLAEGLDYVRRAGLGQRRGQPVLAVELAGDAPEDWRAQLQRLTGITSAVALASVPVDPRHNAKVDRPALNRLLGAEK